MKRKFTGMRPQVSASANLRLSVIQTYTMNKHEFAICVDNHGYEVSLEMRKLYEVMADGDG